MEDKKIEINCDGELVEVDVFKDDEIEENYHENMDDTVILTSELEEIINKELEENKENE